MAYGRAVVGSGLAGACALVLASCYSTGDGIAPPRDAFYYPVGLAVSAGGNVLYVANADFDLQYNGGTLQSYDLNLIRAHTLRTINDHYV
jgi:DNA-binding beta-propeller fold protein YncE